MKNVLGAEFSFLEDGEDRLFPSGVTLPSVAVKWSGPVFAWAGFPQSVAEISNPSDGPVPANVLPIPVPGVIVPDASSTLSQPEVQHSGADPVLSASAT